MRERAGWLRGDLRAAPPAVWWALLAHLLLLVVFTTLQPTYRGLDEPAHVDMVVSLPSPLHWPAPGAKDLSPGVSNTIPVVGADGVPEARLAAGQAPPKDARPSFATAPPTGRPPTANQMVQHPPLYYLVTAGVLRALPGSAQWPFDRQIALMRLVAVLMVAPLPLLAWLAARRLDLPESAGVAAALFPLAVPGLTRVGSSVSNDALLIATMGAAGVLALAVAGGDLRRRTAVALGLLSAAAMLTKGFGLVLLPVVAVAYAVAGARRPERGPAARRGVLALALSALGALWYLHNLTAYGSVQPNGYPGGVLPYPRRPGGGLGRWLPSYVDQMFFRFWSSLGQPEPPQLPHPLTEVLSLVTVVLVLLALLVARRRVVAGVALLPLAGILVLVTAGSWHNYQTYDQFIGVQGRYLYPGLSGLAALVALGVHRVMGRWSPHLLLAGVMVLQGLAVHAMLVIYWTPALAAGDLRAGFASLQAWSPLPDAVVTGLWAVAGAALLATAVAVFRTPQPPRTVDSGAA